MHFSSAASLDKRVESDLLVIPFLKTKKEPAAVAPLGKLSELVKGPIAAKDFTGEHGKTTLLYHDDKKERRVLLLGLGDEEELTVEKLRRAAGVVVSFCKAQKLKKASFLLPELKALASEDVARGVAEGFLLANYCFTAHKGDAAEPVILLDSLALIGASSKDMAVVDECVKVSKGVYLARDLINGNADDITPQHLADVAKTLAKKNSSLKLTVFDKKRLIKEKMGLLLAVGRSSQHDPVMIILEYKGNPKSKETTAVVGKGVTFDTGGLNLKPTGSMETMKSDMSGAAAALGLMQALVLLKPKVNVVAVIPATENSISANSYKPGDVYKGYAGKTVEIDNTDAEGRLILADALAYTVKNLKPARIIDFATLTGAMVIALGSEASGMMATDDALADSLLRSGASTFERLWRMPLFPEYREQIKSENADIKNSGGRPAGSITAALFLKEFVGDIPWAHIDIAGTAYLDKPKRYLPQHATGFGVRLIVDFLKSLK